MVEVDKNHSNGHDMVNVNGDSTIAGEGLTAEPTPLQLQPAKSDETARERKVSQSSGKDMERPSASSSRRPSEQLKPIGIINEQNTCFLNSTFQALSSTGPLISLIAPSPSSNLYPTQPSLLPPPAIAAGRIPANLPDAVEPPIYQLLPVTHAFINSLTRAWRMKDAGGGTYGSGETSSHRSMSLRSLLRELARKYDQYDDYGQQDAHELLRHLLDSMEMEEKDVIKKVQPQAPAPPKKRRGSKRPSNAGVSPMVSPAPSPAPSAPSSPTRSTSNVEHTFPPPPQEYEEVPEDKCLVPFVNVLFGGSLASVVVCENCKSVSHTYEGFLDISLSLKNDNPKPRKRDRFKAMAAKLRPGKSSSSKDSGDNTSTSHTSLSQAVVMSDTEMSDTEPQERDRRLSLDQDDRYHESSGGLSRNSSIGGKTFGIRNKKSFSFGRKKADKDSKGSRPGSSSSSLPTGPGGGAGAPSLPDQAAERASLASSAPSSPVVSARTTHHAHGVGPTPAQMAYIHRILAPPPNAAEIDPLAKLRAANNGDGLAANHNSPATETGLEESLKAFTSVEVLEGENAFACKRCWKIKSGKYKGREATLPEEDETALEMLDSTPTSPEVSALGLRSTHNAPPSIAIADSEPPSGVTSPAGQDNSRLGRAGSVASRSSASAQNVRAPSPLRQQVDVDVNATTRSISNMTISSNESQSRLDAPPNLSIGPPSTDGAGAGDETEDDGLSDTDTSDEDQPDTAISIGRPKPHRRQSSHFIMRRAFKRYLIAKAPEVLIFHFKRFKQTHKTSMMFTSFYDLKKMDDPVSFPEVLDLAPFMAPNRNDYKMAHTPHGPHAPYMDWATPDSGPASDPVNYRLYAVVVHLGTMIGGHYIAYCLVDPEKMFGDMPTDLDKEAGADIESCRPEKIEGAKKDRRVWCFCSDTSIRLATVDEVLAARAYMCFYERVKE